MEQDIYDKLIEAVEESDFDELIKASLMYLIIKDKKLAEKERN